MGSLNKINLEYFKEKYNLEYFVETGTGLGVSLSDVYQKNLFEKLFSCEIFKEVFDRIAFNSDNSFIYNEDSVTFFKIIQKDISNKKCFFWLDAHFPGADFGYRSYNDQIEFHIKFPLEEELLTLSSLKDISKDVILIDDWRIYEKLNWEDQSAYDKRQYDFGLDLPIDGSKIVSVLQSTHDINYLYHDQGYLLCTPIQR